jgi:pilus assembly protein Flp/PilA
MPEYLGGSSNVPGSAKIARTGEKLMKKALAITARLWKNEDGATMVEYGFMLALIALVCIAAVTLLGTNVSAMFNQVAGGF